MYVNTLRRKMFTTHIIKKGGNKIVCFHLSDINVISDSMY